MNGRRHQSHCSSESMAVQGILMCVLRRIAAVDQNLAGAIESGLDDATNLAGRKMRLRLGEGALSGEAAEALRTIERLAGILGADLGGTD